MKHKDQDKDKSLNENDVIDIEVTQAQEPEGSAETNPKQRHGARTRKKRRYTTHGVTSRYPEEALEKDGENMKKLRQTKRELYEELQPHDAVGDDLFDRFWYCHLKLILDARMKKKPVPAEKPLEERVREAGMFAMVGAHPPGNDRNDSPDDAHNQLRYDAHYSREKLRLMAILLKRKSDGNAGAVRMLYKRFVPPKDEEE